MRAGAGAAEEEGVDTGGVVGGVRGEPVNLELTRIGNNRYQAVSYFKAKPKEREAYPFTVSRHGSRWYLSAKVPAKFGGHFTIGGFEPRSIR